MSLVSLGSFYFTLASGTIPTVMRELAPIVRAFAHGDADTRAVMVDALLERSVWHHPTDHGAGRRVWEQGPPTHLLWMGERTIKRAIRGPFGRYGWRELNEIANAHRRIARTTFPQSGSALDVTMSE